jgi:hypothetical protein
MHGLTCCRVRVRRLQPSEMPSHGVRHRPHGPPAWFQECTNKIFEAYTCKILTMAKANRIKMSSEAKAFIASNTMAGGKGKGSAKKGVSEDDDASEEMESGSEDEESGTEAKDEGGTGIDSAADEEGKDSLGDENGDESAGDESCDSKEEDNEDVLERATRVQ